MPLDTHARVAAWLHIAMGALGVCVLVLLGVVFGVFGAAVGASQGAQAGIVGWIVGLGALFFGLFIALPALEIVGAVLLLNGNAAGRVITIIFSALSLLNVPIGTAIGIYSLWALLREVPAPASTSVAAPAGTPQRY